MELRRVIPEFLYLLLVAVATVNVANISYVRQNDTKPSSDAESVE